MCKICEVCWGKSTGLRAEPSGAERSRASRAEPSEPSGAQGAVRSRAEPSGAERSRAKILELQTITQSTTGSSAADREHTYLHSHSPRYV